MPAKSQAQRGYLAAHFGPAWMKRHHFDNRGKLPAHVDHRAALNEARSRRKKRKKQ